ncbi:unnamed protein product [Orchesella dallaii]|uniref:XK-related protein n=1 Tax=Orchesella dallaii TaxID=48710 RepID=A0ABP1PVF6_9HEXA
MNNPATCTQSTERISEMVKNPSRNMSRKNGEEGEKSVRENVEFSVMGQELEKKHQNDKDEKQQLLGLVEDAPLEVQVISAACQSTSSKREQSKEYGEELMMMMMISYKHEPKRNIRNAGLTLILVLFNLSWSVGMSYWNFQLNNFDVAVVSFLIIVVSGSITSITFFTVTSHPTSWAREDLWRWSKVAWLLAAIPCLAPVILAVASFISCVLDKESELSTSTSNSSSSRSTANASGRNGDRQCAKSNATTSAASYTLGAGAITLLLIDSLALCFPMCVLHLCVLMEDPYLIPSFKGLYTLLGLFLLSISITFSRFQFDCLNKRDRFGGKTEKYLRFAYLWSAKIIWLVTFAILIVTARLLYPSHQMEAAAVAAGALAAIHEIPLWICLIPQCGKFAAKVSSLFFLIPQFTSLISLVWWVNTDSQVYETNIGSIVLGVYFWSEAVMLCGWLADGSTDKDVDLVPLYPHFFGDVLTSCFSHENYRSNSLY